MAKDIKMTKGSEEVIINENSIAKFERLGYKQKNGIDKVVIKPQPINPEFKTLVTLSEALSDIKTLNNGIIFSIYIPS